LQMNKNIKIPMRISASEFFGMFIGFRDIF